MAAPDVREPKHPPGVTRVLCVDDNRDITEVMRLVIEAEEGMECVGCLASADHLPEEARRLGADVVLIDASMPGRDPFEALSELAAESPRTRALIFSAWDRSDLVRRAISAGAAGWVRKGDDAGAILRAVREVAAGGTAFPAEPG